MDGLTSITSSLPTEASLNNRLAAAFVHEAHYERVNDAKLRAVAQGSNWDQFHSMVLGADLNAVRDGVVLDQIARAPSQRYDNKSTTERPLHTIDSFGHDNISTVATSMTYAAGTGDAAAMMALLRDQKRSDELSSRLRSEQALLNAHHLPNNVADFERHWRDQCTTPQQKADYFAMCDEPLLLKLFVAGDLETFLGPLMIAIADDFKTRAPSSSYLTHLFSQLRALSSVPRFALFVDFLSSIERTAATTIFEQLASIAASAPPPPPATTTPTAPTVPTPTPLTATALTTGRGTASSTRGTDGDGMMLLPSWAGIDLGPSSSSSSSASSSSSTTRSSKDTIIDEMDTMIPKRGTVRTTISSSSSRSSSSAAAPVAAKKKSSKPKAAAAVVT